MSASVAPSIIVSDKGDECQVFLRKAKIAIYIIIIFLLILLFIRLISCCSDKESFIPYFDNVGTGIKNRSFNQRSASAGPIDNYQEYMKKVALEGSIVKEHNEYARQLNHSTSTSSVNAERSDDNGPVPRWGLSIPAYQQVPIGNDVRFESSESPDQMPKHRGILGSI